jgi:hypothetical protein
MTKISNKERQKVIDKVHKLYALANDRGASQGEVENALKMARKLLAKYNLILQDLDVVDKEFIKEVAFEGKTNRPSWQRNLLTIVCEYFFVMPMAQTGDPIDEGMHLSGNNLKRYIIVGDKTNVQLVNYTLGYLVNTYKSLADQYMEKRKNDMKNKVDNGDLGVGNLSFLLNHIKVSSGVKARNSFYHGLNIGIDEVLTRQVEVEQEEGLMVLNIDPDLQEFVDSFSSGKGKAGKNNAQIDDEAFNQGVDKGKDIKIRSGIDSGDVVENHGHMLGAGKK